MGQTFACLAVIFIEEEFDMNTQLIPKLIKIKQILPGIKLFNIRDVIFEEVQKVGFSLKPGSRIAIAVGSRGIANISDITKAIVDVVKYSGGIPFIVPAMGSHGGADAKGQSEVLKSYGVTEEYLNVPIKSSMDVVEIYSDDTSYKIYMDKLAFEADGVIVVNRIKVHTDYHGPTESGLLKMLVIGLGNHRQATEVHRYGVYGLKEMIPQFARQIIKHGNIVLGVGIVENAYDETMIIKAILPDYIEKEEIELLKISRKNMPSLPTDTLDVLIVDRIGKDISGTGLDTNIVGRIRIDTEKDPDIPRIKRIVITDLTQGSHGNAVGMGIADFMTERLKKKIDFKATYENVVTATFVERGKMPIVATSDRIAVEYALKTCGPIKPENAKIIRIKDTLHLNTMYVSSAVLDEIKDNQNIEVIGDFIEMFDNEGQLVNVEL